MVVLTVKGNASRNSTEADKSTPHLVNGDLAVAGAVGYAGSTLELGLEAEGNEQHDESTSELTNTLHGKDSRHHGTTPLGSREPKCHLVSATVDSAVRISIGITYSEVMILERG